jgi:nucleotide-binding universal stress UspA family protein
MRGTGPGLVEQKLGGPGWLESGLMGVMKTILVPVDLSAITARVCSAACDLARLMKGRVVLLHVIAPPPVVVNEYFAFDTGQMAQAAAAAETSARRRLAALARRFAKRVPLQTLEISGPPVGGILAKAAATKAAYIVMGSHGHRALFELLVGSTTHGVLRRARCPVLIVPAGRR